MAFYNRALQELRRWGECIDDALAPSMAPLVDASSNKRIAGWRVLQRHFLDTAKRLDGYQPTGDAASCRERVLNALSEDQCAALATRGFSRPRT